MLTTAKRTPPPARYRWVAARRSPFTRLGPAVVLAMAGVLTLSSAAHADPIGGTNCDQQSATASCTVSAGNTGGQGQSVKHHAGCHNSDGVSVPCSIPGKGWYSVTDGCYYRPATASEVSEPAASGKRWFAGTCGDPTIGFADWLLFLRQFQTAPGPETVAQLAIAKLRLPGPRIGMSPSPQAPQVIRVPSWFWVAQASWSARSATATAGGVTVTATAQPVSVSWFTGDGATVSCRGPGTAWSARYGATTPSPTCGHTYLTPSPAAGYRVRATVTWQVTWAGAGMTGDAGPLTTPGTVAVHVLDSSAVNTTVDARSGAEVRG